MHANGGSPWKRFWSYVGYGVAACIFLVIPLIAIDWLVKNLPFLGAMIDFVEGLEAPGVGIILGILGVVLLLALMGWVLRRFLWDSLTKAPVIGTLMTSSQQLAKAMGSIDRTRRDVVVWVTFRFYRHLGIVSSRNRDPDGTEYATVYLLSGTGQFQGNSLCNVRVDRLVFPGWTVDDAIVFSSSGGAVVPEPVESPARP